MCNSPYQITDTLLFELHWRLILQSDLKLKKCLNIIEKSPVFPVLYDSKRYVTFQSLHLNATIMAFIFLDIFGILVCMIYDVFANQPITVWTDSLPWQLQLVSLLKQSKDAICLYFCPLITGWMFLVHYCPWRMLSSFNLYFCQHWNWTVFDVSVFLPLCLCYLSFAAYGHLILKMKLLSAELYSPCHQL